MLLGFKSCPKLTTTIKLQGIDYIQKPELNGEYFLLIAQYFDPMITFNKNFSVELTPDSFSRLDEAPDHEFYRVPRFTSHIDEGAMNAVTELYRQYLPENSNILDLMSSWLSHLPEDKHFKRVVGLGLNDREMDRNEQLNEWRVHDLNSQPFLPFLADEFDAALICVSIDYLIKPVTVLKHLGRILKSNAPLIITYSNRYFETKATAAWLHLSDEERGYLIKDFLNEAKCFKNIELLDRSPEQGDPLYAVVAHTI